jgi:DNA (cytosine-5)-methyltransferase 1
MIEERFSRSAGRLVREIRLGAKSYRSEVEDRSDEGFDGPYAWWQSFLRGAAPTACRPAKPTKKLGLVDVFSGCGGLTLGANQAAVALGADTEFLAAVDTDESALEVYQRNFPGVRTVRRNAASLVDFHVSGHGAGATFAYRPEVIDEELAALCGSVDLYLAGPPCQGHSNLNNRTRREDPRNLLYLTAVALGVALESRLIIVENVPDVTKDRSDVVSTAMALLSGSGYRFVDSGVLAAEHLGAAQTRKRFFLIALRARGRRPTSLEEVASRLSRHAAPVRWAIGDLLDCQASGVMDTTPAYSEENIKRIDYLFDRDLYDLPDDVRPECHREGTTYKSVYGRLRWDRPAQTITTGFLTPGRGRFIHPLRRRVLTPREAARLQFFPDSFAFVQEEGVEPSRAALGKWIGDAVPPLLGYAAAIGAIAAIAA